jgi:hypothetical protein
MGTLRTAASFSKTKISGSYSGVKNCCNPSELSPAIFWLQVVTCCSEKCGEQVKRKWDEWSRKILYICINVKSNKNKRKENLMISTRVHLIMQYPV